MLASFGWSDFAYLALAVFLFAAGGALLYAAIRLGGTLGRASSLLQGTETELLPVISKLGGTVDRVNVQLDKVDVMTDSAVDAVTAADTAVRTVSAVVTTADREARRPGGRAQARGVDDAHAGLVGRGGPDGQGGGRSPRAGSRGRAGRRNERRLDGAHQRAEVPALPAPGAEMSDEIVLTLPRERRFYDVAHLVVSGLGARLNLTMDNLADLQLALDGLLPRRETGGDVTVVLRIQDELLDGQIGPFDAEAVAELERIGGDGYGTPVVLRRSSTATASTSTAARHGCTSRRRSRLCRRRPGRSGGEPDRQGAAPRLPRRRRPGRARAADRAVHVARPVARAALLVPRRAARRPDPDRLRSA